MLYILSVDDKPINHEMIRLEVENYFDKNGIVEYKFLTADNGLEALKLIKRYKPQMVFMDTMMPSLTGDETIQCIRSIDDIKHSIVIMVIALHDLYAKQKAKISGANGFIAKPFKEGAISAIFNRYLNDLKKIDLDEDFSDDNFLDFGFDDEFSLSEIQKNKHENKIQKISAQEFLKDYESFELQTILNDVEDLEYMIEEHIEILYKDNLDHEIEHVIQTLEKYASFLNCFSEFQELSSSLSMLKHQIESVDLGNFDSKGKNFIAEYIKATLQDLQAWKNNVFILMDAVDVFYMNDSILNNIVQLESFLKKHTNQINRRKNE